MMKVLLRFVHFCFCPANSVVSPKKVTAKMENGGRGVGSVFQLTVSKHVNRFS